MKHINVSVVMSVFNGGQFLSDAVESILAQTFSDFEFIIINDGSNDGSESLLEQFAARDQRIRLVTRENRGLIASLNEGVSLARAPLIARMDADDIALPERFSRQIAFLHDHPRVVCVGGAMEMIDGDGRFLTLLQPPETDPEIQRLALAGHGSIAHPCAMLRRESLVSIGGYNPQAHLVEDLDLWLRLGEIGQLANLNEPLIRYRLHSGSVSEKRGKEQITAAYEACKRAWQRRGIQGTFEASDSWRPESDRESRCKYMLRYGWWAFNSKERLTAILYGWRAIQAGPLNANSWKLLACALIKPFDNRQ